MLRIISSLREEVACLKNQLDILQKELKHANVIVDGLQKQMTAAQNKILRLEKAYDCMQEDFMESEIMIAKLHDNSKINEPLIQNDPVVTYDYFNTKLGKQYSPNIRKLYYHLLSAQISPSKIASIIRSTLSALFPDVDVSSIPLPAERCAGYMRREELWTISAAHQATFLLDQIGGKFLDLKTDGTTKNQRKLNGTALNGLVLSVAEIPDGKAETILTDVEKQLRKIREIAQKLHLPNAEMINWSLFRSSTSDSASTQKRFNSLLQLRKNDYQEDAEGIDIIQNFYAMHLGVNLRKAFVSGGTKNIETSDSRNPINSLVHEFVKLFGSRGTPEYAIGCVEFPDFLTLKANDDDDSYYALCLRTTLARQVGSRYFVTSHNAARMIFLAQAAIEYLVYTDKNQGNKLERSVFCKLQDSTIMACTKADALMHHHIFADLVTLAKSKDLKKSALDMQIHYLELKIFLDELEKHPEIIADRELKVFKSEKVLYSATDKLNHRNHHSYQCIQDAIFKNVLDDQNVLACIVNGAVSMKEKLLSYGRDQLPGG